MSIKLWIS